MSTRDVTRKLWQKKVIRFACVGVINTCVDVACLNTIVFVFGLKAIIANLFSASISIIISYFLTNSLVFQGQHKKSLKLFLRFVSVTGLSILAVQSLVIYAVTHILTIAVIKGIVGNAVTGPLLKALQVNAAKLVAVLFGMVWNFVLYHLVVFRHVDRDLVDEEALPY